MIQVLSIINKQGQFRLKRYYQAEDSKLDEAAIVKKCLTRPSEQCSFFEHLGNKIVFRRYNSMVIVTVIDQTENELAVLEFIHLFVETLEKYFENLSEMDIMFNLDKVHMILDEMISNGVIVESNMTNILKPIIVMDQEVRK